MTKLNPELNLIVQVDPIRWARHGPFLVSFLAPRMAFAGWCREGLLPV
jgi:hypothetical protein